MNSFVVRANLKTFRRLLATEQDEVKRATSLKLVAEQEIKLAEQAALPGNSNVPPRTDTSKIPADSGRL